MLSRRSKVNLGLAALVLILALTAYLAPDPGRGDRARPLTDLVSKEIDRIRISDNHGRNIEFERQADQWIMVAPFRAAANQERVTGLLRIATTHSYLRMPSANLGLDAYGLAKPTAFLILNGTELAIGSTEPVNFRRYILVDGMINLIDDGFYHHLMAQPEAFIVSPEPAAGPGPSN